jgi:hypothetical protein
MLLDLATLKARLGIDPSDTTQDLTIEMLATQAQALAETYCDRAFDYGPDDETFPGVNSSFQVHRYPIASIDSLTLGSDLDTPIANPTPIAWLRTDPAKGLVWPGGYGYQNWYGGWQQGVGWIGGAWSGGTWPVIRCLYTGGYQTAPVDLAWALTLIFDILWSTTPGAGVPVGDVGAAAFDAVKRFSVVGAYAVELATSADQGSKGGGDNTWGILPPSVTAVLDGYTRAPAIGIA